jgi:hypothetical protein
MRKAPSQLQIGVSVTETVAPLQRCCYSEGLRNVQLPAKSLQRLKDAFNETLKVPGRGFPAFAAVDSSSKVLATVKSVVCWSKVRLWQLLSFVQPMPKSLSADNC